jgi:hypothetical protein
VLYLLFFLPGVVAMTWAGWSLRHESLAIREQTFNADPIPLYPFKFVIPLAGAICCCRAWWRSCAASSASARGMALARAGRGGSRRRQAQGHGHVKDEDIQALDKFVTREGAAR